MFSQATSPPHNMTYLLTGTILDKIGFRYNLGSIYLVGIQRGYLVYLGESTLSKQLSTHILMHSISISIGSLSMLYNDRVGSVGLVRKRGGGG